MFSRKASPSRAGIQAASPIGLGGDGFRNKWLLFVACLQVSDIL